MKKQIRKIPEIKTGVLSNSVAKTANKKKPVASSHKKEKEMDEDEEIHKRPEKPEMDETGKERDLDDMIHENSGSMPEAEDDNEYFDDEDLDDLAYER